MRYGSVSSVFICCALFQDPALLTCSHHISLGDCTVTAACSCIELFDKDTVGMTGRIFCRKCLESGIVCCFAHGQAGLTVLGGKITWFQWPSAHTQSRGCVCCHQRDLSLTMLTLVTGLRCWLSGSPCCPLWREVTYVHQRFIPIPP